MWLVLNYQGYLRLVGHVDSQPVLDLVVVNEARRASGRRYESDRFHRPPSDLRAATYLSSLLLR